MHDGRGGRPWTSWSVACEPTRETPPRVLIVDDSACFREVARRLLCRRGYTVVGEAESVAAGLDAAYGLEPDAMLVDTRLPDGSGFEVCTIVTVLPPAPAVLLTSSDDFPGVHALAEASRARGFVLKSELARCDLGIFWPRPRGPRWD
jgi:DNA-binding NarL/FixJ family response regulator